MRHPCSAAVFILSSLARVWGTTKGTCTNATTFQGNGFAQFFNNFSAGENFSIYMMYKSSSCNGVLLYAQSNPSRNINDHIMLQLQDGEVQFEFNNAESNVLVTVMPSPNNTTQFCDGRWQSLLVTKFRRTSSLFVGGEYSTVSSGGTFNSTDTDGSLYLGGLPDNLPILRASIPVKAHFTGLLSNVQFSNGKGIFPLSYEYAIFSKGVQRDESSCFEDVVDGNKLISICKSVTSTTTPSEGSPPGANGQQYSLDSPLMEVVITLGTLCLLLCLLCSIVIVLLICSHRKKSKINYCHKIVTPPAITINQIAPSSSATVAALHKAQSPSRLGVSHLSTWSSSTGSCIYVEPMAYDDTYDSPIYENQCANVYQTIQSAHSEAKRYSSLNRPSVRVPVTMAWAPVTEEQNSHED